MADMTFTVSELIEYLRLNPSYGVKFSSSNEKNLYEVIQIQPTLIDQIIDPPKELVKAAIKRNFLICLLIKPLSKEFFVYGLKIALEKYVDKESETNFFLFVEHYKKPISIKDLEKEKISKKDISLLISSGLKVVKSSGIDNY